MSQADLIASATALRKQGRVREALDRLRDGLRRGVLDAEGVDWAGRLLRKEILAGATDQAPLRVLLLGQCTTSWLVNALTAHAWGDRVAVLASEGGYDNILQALSSHGAGEGERPDVVVLIPWNTRLLGGGGGVEDELAFWRQAWGMVSGRLGSRLVQVGYDWVHPGAAGHCLGGRTGGPVGLVRRVNAALRDGLPPGAFFLDLEQVSGTVGRASFYDPRRYYWTKQPFSESGACHLAGQIWSGVRALTTGPKKVLVVDLDNTLWGGVVGEVGPLAVALGDSPDGEAFRGFQKHLKDLAARGVVLAAASKNNPDDARAPFETNPEMVLKLDDFGAFEASWEPKGVTIARIARTLDLGLDSFVFFDDNPAEREQVRQALPEVTVAEVPEDPAGYVGALQAGLWFEAAALTEADRERAAQYAVERKRRGLQESFTSMDDYLRSLEMRAEVREIDGADLPRVVQLVAKTNQFNLTTRRHTREDLLGLTGRPRSIPLTLRMADRFGDYGLVSVLLGVPASDPYLETVSIDTWLMSCRVIGRTAEEFFFGEFLSRARQIGYRQVVGEYVPTPKNALVSDLYDRLGFRRVSGGDGRGVRYALDVDGATRPTTFVAASETVVR
jgi:FkbH-like protein